MATVYIMHIEYTSNDVGSYFLGLPWPTVSYTVFEAAPKELHEKAYLESQSFKLIVGDVWIKWYVVPLGFPPGNKILGCCTPKVTQNVPKVAHNCTYYRPLYPNSNHNVPKLAHGCRPLAFRAAVAPRESGLGLTRFGYSSDLRSVTQGRMGEIIAWPHGDARELCSTPC